MRTLVVFFVVLVRQGCLAYYHPSSNYFCTHLNPQNYVNIGQLEGIWYVIEKIIHTEERQYIINMTTCPVIHISEDRSQSTTYNPLHKTYESTYGSGYPYESIPQDPSSPLYNEQQYIRRKQEEYDQRTTYDYDRRRGNHASYIKHLYGMRYLKLYFEDSLGSTEYHVRYNVSEPGYWISSGPEDGRVPEERKHFAGLIQVIKAVGNHLVLTFCHPSPERNQLFTVILAREVPLGNRGIFSVHSQLLQKGLSTRAVEKSCNKAPTNGLSLALSVFVSVFYILYFVK